MKPLLFIFAAFISLSAHAENVNGQIFGDLNFGPRLTPPVSAWTIPNYTPAEQDAILTKYNYLDPQHVVTSEPLEKALFFFEANKDKIPNQKYLTIVDYHIYSGTPRFFLINLTSGAVAPFLVAHGKGSDANNTGYADRFSNVDGSLMSSLGFLLTAETYIGHNGNSLRIDGLSVTNSNVRERMVVIHGSAYVNASVPRIGRSFGCLALDQATAQQVIGLLKGGSLVYTWTP